MKSKTIPFTQEQEPREALNFSEVEVLQRFRDSSDAGVRTIELAFNKYPYRFMDPNSSPVVETTSREEWQSTLHLREFLGFRFGKPRVVKFHFPEKVRRRMFLWRPKLPYSID